MTSPLHVLHVIGSLDPGGVESWLLGLANETRPHLNTYVCVLGNKAGSLEDAALDAGIKVLRCPLRPAVSFPIRFLGLLRRERPHILHAHVHCFSGYLVALARWAGVPVRVAHSHNASDGRGNGFARRAYRVIARALVARHATHGIAASGVAGDDLFGAGWQKDSRFRIIRCGVDLKPFASSRPSSHIRAELGLPDEAPVVGHVGRFDRQKNHTFVIEVARVLSAAEPTVRFLFVGEGPSRPSVEQLAREAGLAQRCVFAGRRRDVPRILLGAIDCLLFPSLWEGLPVALVEAQAAGLPIVASDRITREVSIVPGLVTFLSLAEGPERWAHAVREGLRTPRLAAALACGRMAQSSFDIRESAIETMRLYGLPVEGLRES